MTKCKSRCTGRRVNSDVWYKYLFDLLTFYWIHKLIFCPLLCSQMKNPAACAFTQKSIFYLLACCEISNCFQATKSHLFVSLTPLSALINSSREKKKMQKVEKREMESCFNPIFSFLSSIYFHSICLT